MLCVLSVEFEPMKIIENLTKRWWRLLAVAIVVLVAGPEVLIYAEGMAILELIGAATFVFMYVVGFKLYFYNAWNAFYRFENRYHFFLPSFSIVRESPGLLYYAIPRRSTIYAVFLMVSLVTLVSVKAILV